MWPTVELVGIKDTTVETITSTTAIACRQNQRRRRSANRSRGSEVLPKNAPSVIGKGPNVIRRRLAMSAALALKLGLTMALDTPLSLSSWPENSKSSADKVVGAAVAKAVAFVSTAEKRHPKERGETGFQTSITTPTASSTTSQISKPSKQPPSRNDPHVSQYPSA